MLERLGERVSPEGSLEGAVAILPTGACEAHGPHLPLDSDVRIATGMAERAAARIRATGRSAWVLPPLTYGVTQFARNFPGTLTISAETLTALAAEVLEAAHAAGASGLAIANAHLEPANVDALFAACARVQSRTGARVAFPHPGSRRNAARLAAAAAPLDGHSGVYETSLLLALAPGLVRDPSRLPENPASLADGIVSGATCFEEAGGPRAYFGDPARASAALGERLLDELAAMLCEAIDAVGLSDAPRSPG
jgi:creatinine amidohydrolase